MYTEIAMTETWRRLLRPGSEMYWNGIHCRVLQWNDEEPNSTPGEGTAASVVIEHVESKRLRKVSISDLSTGIETGQLVSRQGEDLPDPNAVTHVIKHMSALETFSEPAKRYVVQIQDWKAALWKRDVNYINPNNSMHLQIIEDLKKDKTLALEDFNVWTIYRGLKKIRDANGDITQVVPKYHLRGRPVVSSETTRAEPNLAYRISRLHPLVDSLLTQLIEAARKDIHHKMRPTTIRRDLKTELEKQDLTLESTEGIALPSAVTVSRRISKAMDQYEVDKHRTSVEATDERYRANGGRISAERILEVVQFDDIDTRAFLIDPDTGLVWGTPNMTFGVDERSRAVMGHCYGAEHRNIESAVMAVHSAIRQKDMSAPEFEKCEKPWEMRGKPGLVILDNASYNKGEAFKATLLAMGLDYALARPKTPTNKSAVEHFNFRFKHDFVAGLAGSCVNKKDADGAKRAMKSAKYTLEEFGLKAFQYITDVYLPERMSCGQSPLEIWQSQAPLMDLQEPKLIDLNFHLFSIVERHHFKGSGGVERNTLRYNNEELEGLQRRIGWKSKVTIRVNPQSLESIYVLDPQNKDWFIVPCNEDPSYTRGLTNDMHQKIMSFKRQLKNELKNKVTCKSIDKDDLQEEAIKLCKSKLLTDRGDGFRIKLAFRGGTNAIFQKRASGTVYTLPIPKTEAVEPPQIPASPEIPPQKAMDKGYLNMIKMMTERQFSIQGVKS